MFMRWCIGAMVKWGKSCIRMNMHLEYVFDDEYEYVCVCVCVCVSLECNV